MGQERNCVDHRRARRPGGRRPVAKQRAEIDLPVLLNTAPVEKGFSLVGPGDIIGINRDMIVRTQPLNWITDFEPNYLVFAEFYDEDFLWRYTPASPKDPAQPDGPPTDRLRPWLFLAVLKEDEFERTKEDIFCLPSPLRAMMYSRLLMKPGFGRMFIATQTFPMKKQPRWRHSLLP